MSTCLSKQMISDALEAENKALKALKNVVISIIDEIKDVEVDGVKRINANCGSVSINTIFANNTILCPHYYLSTTVKDEISKSLNRITRISDLVSFIQKTVDTGYVGGKDKNTRLRINPAIMEKFKNLLLEITNI